jgi:hypothetical protein
MTVLSFSKKRWDENTGFSPHCTFEILENLKIHRIFMGFVSLIDQWMHGPRVP